ncbi:hypothetical protein PSCICO_26520 [Pseudomonas cichorii]|nr:hypothetical protein PSCICO_26520 [Pseudomonas cichorii]
MKHTGIQTLDRIQTKGQYGEGANKKLCQSLEVVAGKLKGASADKKRDATEEEKNMVFCCR